MNRFFQVIVFLLMLWIISFAIANLFFESDGDISLGEKVAVIPIKGMITLEGGSNFLSSSTSGSEIAAKIKDANEDSQIKAIVLEINSGGGTVLGSKIVADAIKEVEKPIVASISEYGASGAYWIASQTDTIVADDLSFVGSISVLGSHLEFAGLLQDYNVTYRRLNTGEYKDIGTPYREMTEDEEALLMERLQGVHDYFVQEVATGRDMSIEEIDELANGLFYLGYEAKDLGLVDELGDREYAIDLAEEMAGIEDGAIKEYEEKESFFDMLTQYTSHMGFFIGQGIGSVLISQNTEDFKISL
ncbi:signal peptide peptidase SppA [archaeon]|nr:signal peptide peptidase SppA [archaeon]MBT4397537.1 signal peptide peptidase SppA [archaeon]MBT4440794.1 signal peptide peptidase SppA [archaeon]